MRKLGLFIILIFFLSCSKEGVVENIYTIPEEFKLDLTQVLSDNGPIPAFDLTTLDKIGCSDQQLKTEYSRITNNAYIKIIGVEIVEPCITADYISSQISDNFNEGLYNFMIQVKNDVENQGTFSVRDDYFSITMYKSPNILLGDAFIKRLPADVWWGAVYFTDNYSKEQSEKLKNILDDHSTVLPELKTGNYGLFEVTESEKVIIEKFKYHPGYYGFCLKQNLTETSLVEKINSMLLQNPGGHVYLASDKKVILDI
jgi:hypothetical protein